MLAHSTLIAHFWQFFFVPPEQGVPWYHGQVWGNVVAVLPLALLGAAGFAYHHFVLRRVHRQIEARHDEHSRRLCEILNVLDPDSEGGLSVVLDRLDTRTPDGLKTVLDAIEHR